MQTTTVIILNYICVYILKLLFFSPLSFKNISMENPYKVMAGFINTNQQDTSKIQVSLGIKAKFHPDPLVAFILIKASR